MPRAAPGPDASAASGSHSGLGHGVSVQDLLQICSLQHDLGAALHLGAASRHDSCYGCLGEVRSGGLSEKRRERNREGGKLTEGFRQKNGGN